MSWAGHVARTDEKRKVSKILVENHKERHHSEDLGVDGRMESEWILVRLAGCAEWIQLAQDRGRWWAVVSEVMNFRVLAPRSWSVSAGDIH
jgi:hypothetical protein